MCALCTLGNKSNPLPPTGQPPATSQSNNPGWGPSNAKPPAGPPATVPNTNTNANSQTNNGNPAPQSNSTKQQLEQLTNMREAIYSQDGWGGVS